jgi:hypothetical protein
MCISLQNGQHGTIREPFESLKALTMGVLVRCRELMINSAAELGRMNRFSGSTSIPRFGAAAFLGNSRRCTRTTMGEVLIPVETNGM